MIHSSDLRGILYGTPFAVGTDEELLETVRYLVKFEKQAKLVDLANQAARAEPPTAMEHWRALLALADDAAGGCIDAEEWGGLCANMYALLRGEQERGQ